MTILSKILKNEMMRLLAVGNFSFVTLIIDVMQIFQITND